MGGFVNGPVIRFLVDAPGLSAAVGPAMADLKNQARAASSAVAEEWRRSAAQIRASIASGVLSEKEALGARKQLVGVLDQEIAALRQRDELSKKQLTNLKAMTLELERQKSFVAGGAGLTRGTENALGQVSLQTTLGIERAMDAVINRYFGGATSSLFRTFRDISYYSAQAGGAQRQGGMFGGFIGGFQTILSSISPATLAIGGMTTALAGEVAILAGATKHMIDYAQSVQNMAAATGLSVTQVQQYNELAKITGVDAESLSMAFARMQTQLGELYTTGGKAASGSQFLVKVLDQLGVSAKDSDGNLRPINDILGDFAKALDAVPNRANQTALAMEAMGTRGRVLVQIMEQARASGMSLTDMLHEMNKVTLPESEIRQLLKEKAAWDSIVVSIDAAKIHLEGYIATHAKEIGLLQGNYPLTAASASLMKGVGGYFYNPGAPGSPAAPTPAAAAGLMAQYQQKANAELLKQAEIIRAGGKAQYDLLQAEKSYAEAIKDKNGEDAKHYAEEIKSLQKIVELENARASILARFNWGANASAYPRRPRVGPLSGRYPGFVPWNQPPSISSGAPSITGPLTGIGLVDSSTVDAVGLLKQIQDEHDKLFKTEEQRAREHYDQELKDLNRAHELKLLSEQEYNDAVLKLTADLNKQLTEKYKGVADSLFEGLISGNAKGFSQTLEKQVEDILLAPLKKQFESIFSQLLYGLNSTVNGGRGGAGSPVPSIGWLGKIFGFGGVGPGGTAGTFAGPLGLGGAHGTGTVAIQTGQTGVSTPTMYVQAQVVNLSGGGTSGSGIPALGNFFGAAGLFPPFGNFFGNLNPFGGANAGFGGLSISGIGGLGRSGGGNYGQIIGGLLLGGLGASSGSVSSEAMGAAAVAGGLAKIFSGNATVTRTINGQKVQVPLGKILSQGFAGAGLLASGISQGGVGGAFEDIAGGAEIGTAIMPGIGTAIGAIAGAITGLFRGIFGGKSWAQKVQEDMRKQAIYLPPGENFSFASNGSISSTLGTGFGNAGGHFFGYALPANTPFYANPIYGPLTNRQQIELQQLMNGMNVNQPFLGFPAVNPFVGQTPKGYAPYHNAPVVHINLNLPGYIDAASSEQALLPLGEKIARIVSSKFSQGSSGLGWGVRSAVALP